MDAAEVWAIHQLLALYGQVIDERQFSRMPEIFTEDVVFDATDFGEPVHIGRDALTAAWRTSQKHPLAHHATNVVIGDEDGDTVHVVSKGIGVGARGRVGSVTYRDVIRRTLDGWRIAHRVAMLRSVDRIPPES